LIFNGLRNIQMGQHILMTPRKPRQSVEHVTGKQPEAKKRGIEDTAGIPTGVALTSTVARLAQRIPLMTVKKWLGRARFETTAIYVEVSGDEERELAKRLWQKPKNLWKSTWQNGVLTQDFAREPEWVILVQFFALVECPEFGDCPGRFML